LDAVYPQNLETFARCFTALSAPEDIVAVNSLLIDLAQKQPECGHVPIDSHPLTTEHNRFRVTA